MIKHYLLIILLIGVFCLIFKQNIETFIPFTNHTSTNCNNYPFPIPNDTSDPCMSCEYTSIIPQYHINNISLDEIMGITPPNIHVVNPNHPCCLRTCINDFTPTKENTIENKVPDKPDTWREGIVPLDDTPDDKKNSHYFYTSRCNECVRNFKPAMEKLYQGVEQCDV